MESGTSATTVQRALSQSPPLEGTITLRVTSAPDAGKTLVIDDGQPTRVLVGRSPSCELRVEDTSVSRRHAAFELVAGQLRVTDLESRNGTWINEVSIVEATVRGG